MNRLLGRFLCAVLPEGHPGMQSRQVRLSPHQFVAIAAVLAAAPRGTTKVRVVRNRAPGRRPTARVFTAPRCPRCGGEEF